jgi:hypothetical protein
MASREELHKLIDTLPDAVLGEVIDLAKFLGQRAAQEAGLEAESREWLDADLAPPLEPYEWGDLNPLALGNPVRFQPGEGLVIEER